MTYCSETETDRFVKAIASLSPRAGDDCPELTFKGMSDAIHEGPYPDSPLYVFTDDGPKDATHENIVYLKEIAQDQGVVVNFFVVKNPRCSTNADLSSFQEIAEATMGQVFKLEDHKELKQLEGLTASSLGGTAVVANAVHFQTFRRKRSLSKTSDSYSISVDDSIDTLVVSVTADHSTAGGNTWSASLISPTGTITGASSNSLDQGTVYQISKPNVGIWSLGITADSNVNYDFMVKASSTNNIDFEYYFVRTTVKRGVSTTVPIAAPLQGKISSCQLFCGIFQGPAVPWVNKNVFVNLRKNFHQSCLERSKFSFPSTSKYTNSNIGLNLKTRLKAVFQLRVLHTYVHARKSLNQYQCYI